MSTGEPAVDLEQIVRFRRDLHRHPELRFNELRTAGEIARRLAAAGFEVRRGVGGTGVTATLGSAEGGRHIAVRADMDALPIPDLKRVEYASTVQGVCHACGHDVHTAVVVGLGEHLANQDLLPGFVTLIFQPAEEIPFGERSGAEAVISSGLLPDRFDAVLGIHCWPELPVGTVGVDDCVAMAAKDAFRIRCTGISAHAATPEHGRDAILAISHMVVSLYAIGYRSVGPGQRIALNVGTAHGGFTQSVVPSEAEITGTLRTVDEELRARIRSEIERITEGVARACGVDHTIEWKNEMPAVVNDPELVRRARAALESRAPALQVRDLSEPPMTSDDFALYNRKGPGLYLKIGVCGDEPCYPLHHGAFDVDERAIGVGIQTLGALVTDLLEH